jgi:hypothetical protein
MKTERLKPDETGQYPGSLSYTQSLTESEQRLVQEAIAGDQPLHLSEIAAQAGIVMTDPRKVQALRSYLETTLRQSGDAEMAFQPRPPTVTGRTREGKEFMGWRATAQLREAIAKKKGEPPKDE